MALRLDPGHAPAWVGKGNAFNDQGKYDGALLAYNEAIRLYPEFAIAWCNKGNALYYQRKYNEAFQAYNEALRLDPGHAMALVGKGNVFYNQGDYDEAIQAFDEAIRLDPELVLAWNGKGVTLVALSKYDEAIQAFNEGIRLDPGDAMVQSNKDLAIQKMGKSDSVETVASAGSISDNIAMDVIKKSLGDGGFSDVTTRIGDGRSEGGVKVLILSYRSEALTTEDFGLETSTILGSFLGTVEAGWDCDELWVAVGDRFGTAIGMWYCSKEWKEAYIKDSLTAEEVLLSVLGTMETL